MSRTPKPRTDLVAVGFVVAILGTFVVMSVLVFIASRTPTPPQACRTMGGHYDTARELCVINAGRP